MPDENQNNKEENFVSIIKADIINTFDENFYDVYVDNSDGISGHKSLKEKFTPIEIEDILNKIEEKAYLNFCEKYENTPILDNILNVVKLFNNLNNIVISNKKSILLESHFKELEKISIKRMNKKNKVSKTKEEWFNDFPDLEESLKNLIIKKWDEAHLENYNNSLNLKYWKFEENLILNYFPKTVSYF